jgi:hypothetical protein
VRGILGSLVVIGLLGAAPAGALAGEDDRSLSVNVGFTTFTAGEDLLPYGGLVGAEYERGISESWSWRLAAAGGLLYEDGTEDLDGGLVWRAQAIGGLVYLFDVLKYVPYATIGLGAVARGGGPVETDLHPVLELGGGVDLLKSRTFSWGGFVRVSSYLDDEAAFTIGGRATWRWGLF